MPSLIRDDGASLEYQVVEPAAPGSDRRPFIFQHGMGGNRNQPLGYVKQIAKTTLVCMDARGHGGSSDVTDDHCSFDAFADDIIALADDLGFDTFVAGGISLGAGTALNLAVRYPERVAGLVLCRPAWLEHRQAERNTASYELIANLLDEYETEEALDRLTASEIYRGVAAESAAAAQSLRHQITRPKAAVNASILRRFPTTAPTSSREQWAAITVPSLVVGHLDDPFHPWEIAKAYSEAIPAADLVEVTSKDRDPVSFTAEVDAAISGFVDSTEWKSA
ncbi:MULTISPECIES: alpha/beta fold hydrolase [unclassified Arthrobacter]|uniref:alpha/beta fold hydrolase n=1 Tax=unclassified Arthrobacter TaxID=235627 RepID=UPI001C863263|nr:alpha/beta hydrolase [Arthrobacter sp. MAHUQ-56]MBX7445950.1 alpha/beta hydrolase [Arthrobacter sp. MAHUQ-56]